MKPEEVESMVERDRQEWDALCSVLNERPPDEPLHEKGQPEWTSKHVYAHLARWMELSTRGIEAWLAGRMPPIEEGTDDEVNLRWSRLDASLSLEDARAKAFSAFERRVEAISSIPMDRWDSVLDDLALADGWKHYEAHRKGIVNASDDLSRADGSTTPGL